MTTVLCVAFSAGLLLSHRLWLGGRDYPLTPVADFLPGVPKVLNYLLFAALLALPIAIAVVNKKRPTILVLAAISIVLCAADQSRLQPWFYQYVFMFVCLGLSATAGWDQKVAESPLDCCRIVLIAVYFWAGIQKLNAGFALEAFPFLVNPYLKYLFGHQPAFPHTVALVVPVIEVLIAIGLVTRRFRNRAVIAAVVTHIAILGLLVPVRFNSVVWPWNIAMGCFAVLVFWNESGFGIERIVRRPTLSFQNLIFFVFGVLPFFSFFGFWDAYLSSSLYSGNVPVAIVVVDGQTKEMMPAQIKPYFDSPQADGTVALRLNRWSYKELNVPAYPEPRVFLNVAKNLCAQSGAPAGLKLKIRGRPDWIAGKREVSTFSCLDL